MNDAIWTQSGGCFIRVDAITAAWHSGRELHVMTGGNQWVVAELPTPELAAIALTELSEIITAGATGYSTPERNGRFRSDADDLRFWDGAGVWTGPKVSTP